MAETAYWSCSVNLPAFRITNLSSRVPLIKSIIFLRDLKGIVARRKVKLMAIVLNKLCNAANVPFRSRPKGLTGLFVLSVIIFHQVPTCFQNNALITSKPVSQKHHRLNQRYPRAQDSRGNAVSYLLLHSYVFGACNVPMKLPGIFLRQLAH